MKNTRWMCLVLLCWCAAINAPGQLEDGEIKWRRYGSEELVQADSLFKAGQYWLVEFQSRDFRVAACSSDLDAQYGLQHHYIDRGCMVFEDDPTITDLWLHNNRVLMAVDSIRGTDLFKTYRARRDSCVPNFCGGKEELTDVWTPSGIGRLSTWHFRQGEDTLNASHQCAIDNTLVPILEQLEGVEIHIRFAELKDWTDAMKSLPMERALAVRAHLLEGVDAPERILLKPIHSDELIFINYAPLEYQLQSVFCELRWQTSGR